jgi:hypothetical protein
MPLEPPYTLTVTLTLSLTQRLDPNEPYVEAMARFHQFRAIADRTVDAHHRKTGPFPPASFGGMSRHESSNPVS